MVDRSTMLPAASHLFLSEVGRGHLHELRSLDDSDKVKSPLSLVVKKRRWYWIHSVIDPTASHVRDLIAPGAAAPDIPMNEASEVTDFESSTTFSVKGEIGGQLAKLFQVKLSGSDVISFHAPLGKVMMHSVDINAVCKALNHQKVDMENIYVAGYLKSNWKSSVTLAVVTESWYVANDVTLTASIEWSAEADASGTPMNVNASGNISKKREFNFTLQAGTVIAFRTMDLEIDSSTGELRCIPESMVMKFSCAGCHFSQDTMDGGGGGGGGGGDYPAREILRVRSLPGEALRQLQKNAAVLLGHPAAVAELFRLINAVEDRNSDLELAVDGWSNEEKVAAQILLEGAGLTMKEGFVIEISPQQNFNLFFHALAMVVSSMAMLPEAIMNTLSKIDLEGAQKLFDSIRTALRKWEAGKPLQETLQDVEIAKMIGMAPEAQLRPEILESVLRVLASLQDVRV